MDDGSDKRLHSEVKQCIIERLGLPQRVQDIPDDIPLFSGGLGLDSIDALDLVVALSKRFAIVIEEDEVKILQSVNHIVDFIEQQRQNTSHEGQ